MEDGIAVAAGAVASVVANKLINSYIPEGQADMIGKIIPVAKAAGGIYLATMVKDRRAKFFGLGMAATGAIELGQKFAPEFVAIGSAGDIYERLGGLGTSLTEIPLSISGANYGSYGEPAVLGMEMASL
jgi:hypothetical protein